MSAKALDVFSLRDAVVSEYKKFATSFTTIHAEDIRQQVEAIYAKERYWPEPLIQINPSYKRTASIDKLVADGVLEAKAADIFRTPSTPDAPHGEALSLYKHQEQAVALASQGESYVVTTGTGSGKSLCFFIPIVNTVLAEKPAGGTRRTRAIIIYPMNALANSQLEELDKFVKNVSGEKPVSFARYTGQDDTEERRRISENPPDILLTNFMMLELLMTRQDELDRKVIGNCAGLRFLVLDELHTYRGRQGADVALLVRRVRERLSPEKLQCIGTSATMASEGSLEDKSRAVARVASKLFSIEVPESNVIVETLERVTDPAQNATSVLKVLGPSIDAGLPPNISDADLRTHPLVIWVETRLGVSWSEIDQRWVRARPLTVDEASRALSQDAGREVSACRTALRDLLLISTVPEAERTGSSHARSESFFAFKLHQFISGAGHAFSTLETPGQRTVTVEGQQFLPGDQDKRLYPVHFCRDCGHEYHPVKLVSDGGDRIFHARDIDDSVPARPDDDDESAVDDPEGATEGEVFGFLTPHARDADFTFSDRDEDYPETWLEFDGAGNPRLKKHYRGARPYPVTVAPNGKLGSGTKALFVESDDGLPLIEGRHIAQFDHCAKAYQSGRGRAAVWEDLPHGHRGKHLVTQWRIPEDDVPEKLRGRYNRYRACFCKVTSPTNERTLIAALVPQGCLCGDSIPTVLFEKGYDWLSVAWVGVANSFALDYIARKKTSLNLTFTVLDSLPFPRFEADDAARFIVPRVARLTCTGPEMSGLWNQLATGGWVPAHTSAATVPGEIDEDKRAVIRAELDAYIAKDVFGLTRDELAYVLDTFPIVEKRDRKSFGEYRTKRMILDRYDAMTEVVPR